MRLILVIAKFAIEENLMVRNIKELQELIGVTVDGVWDQNLPALLENT